MGQVSYSRNYYHAFDREQQILKYMPLVQKIAGKMVLYSNGLLDRDDLVSLGVIGLIQALDKFDTGRGYKFESYATSRIRGAILDELRSLSWRPRSVMDKVKKVMAAQDRLAARGVSYSDVDVARELDEDVEMVKRTMSQFNASVLLSFDEIMFDSDSGQTRHDHIADSHSSNPEDEIIASERKSLLSKAITKLPERDQQILALYYQEDLTLKQIGQVLKISEGRVCQIHARALARLKTLMG